MAEPTPILKLITETEGVVYFKILDEETTAFKVIQICHIKNGVTHLKYRHKIYSNIHKSEIDQNYIFVDHPEIEQLKQNLQEVALSDVKLLIDVFGD